MGDDEIKVLPNPTTDFVTITSKTNYTLEVYNLLGLRRGMEMHRTRMRADTCNLHGLGRAMEVHRTRLYQASVGP